MSEDQDRSQKTEEPTEKRLQDAREKGQLAQSREVNNFFILAAAAFLLVMVPSWGHELLRGLSPFLRDAGTMAADPAALGRTLLGMLFKLGIILAAPFGVFVIAAVAAGGLQSGLIFTPEPLKPKFEKISPLAGIKRLFSLKSIVEFIKNLCKISAAAAIAGALLWPERLRLVVAGRLPVESMTDYLGGLLLMVVSALAAATALLAGADYAYQRFEYRQQMRMSKRDVEDEQKQSEGDPKAKQRLRAIRTERSRRRMMAAVPEATVVITNPTHYAVALRYERDSMPAPEVVAKGVDHLALKIRQIATEHGVPIVENPPLARALHKATEPGQIIPEQHFKAVAEVIGFVMQRQRPAGGVS